MYADTASDASFLHALVLVDKQLLEDARSGGCRKCRGGPLHVAHYPRKPRGLAESLDPLFSQRFSLCCGHCRKRCTPPSVRFLGRKVYVGLIVILATMRTLVCGASRLTLKRWSMWWIGVVPQLTFWTALKARMVPAVDETQLPGSLLERFEAEPGGQSTAALLNMLRALTPITTSSYELDGGAGIGGWFTQKMRFDCNCRDALRTRSAPTDSS